MYPRPSTPENPFYDADATNVVGRFTVGNVESPDYVEITREASEYLGNITANGGIVQPFNIVKIGNMSDAGQVVNITASVVATVHKINNVTWKLEAFFPAGSFDDVSLDAVGIYNSDGVCLIRSHFTMVYFYSVDSLSVEVDIWFGKVVRGG
jgi:hypothetical protein